MPTASPRVIKAGHKAAHAETTYNFLDLRQRCEQYAADIREQCKSWIVDARAECDAIRDAAYKEGRQAGLKDGLADAAAQVDKRSEATSAQKTQTALASATPAVQQAAVELEEERQRWLATWERAAVELAIAIAGRLTTRMIEADPSVLVDRTRAALELVGGSKEAVLHMHPDDVAALGDLATSMTSGSPVEVVQDARVERGGCVLSSQAGEVDGQLATQLDRIAEELLGQQ